MLGGRFAAGGAAAGVDAGWASLILYCCAFGAVRTTTTVSINQDKNQIVKSVIVDFLCMMQEGSEIEEERKANGQKMLREMAQQSEVARYRQDMRPEKRESATPCRPK